VARVGRKEREEVIAGSRLVRAARYIQRGSPPPMRESSTAAGGRQADEFHRERWRHDNVVRSTHGVNCTGSCSWRVYVKDGIITWETQAVDHPSIGPSSPEYERRGCPRGASFSSYSHSLTLLLAPLPARASAEGPNVYGESVSAFTIGSLRAFPRLRALHARKRGRARRVGALDVVPSAAQASLHPC
jgi:hypothetical protein